MVEFTIFGIWCNIYLYGKNNYFMPVSPLRLFIVCDQLIKRNCRPKNIHSALTDSVITTQQWNSQKLFQYQETRLNYSSFWYDIDTESSFNCFSMWLWLLIFVTSKLNRTLTLSLKLYIEDKRAADAQHHLWGFK